MPTKPLRRKAQRRDPEIFPPISDAHAQAIGHVIANWSKVEEALAFLVGAILGIEGTPRDAVTADLTSIGRYEVIKALLNATRVQEWADEWETLEETFYKLNAQRNDVTHAVWHVVAPSHWAYRVAARSGGKLEFGEFSTERLNELSELILDYVAELDSFGASFMGAVSPALRAFQSRPALVPGQSQKALARAQARAKRCAEKAKGLRPKKSRPRNETGER
jgi:hypothetical protein